MSEVRRRFDFPFWPGFFRQKWFFVDSSPLIPIQYIHPNTILLIHNIYQPLNAKEAICFDKNLINSCSHATSRYQRGKHIFFPLASYSACLQQQVLPVWYIKIKICHNPQFNTNQMMFYSWTFLWEPFDPTIWPLFLIKLRWTTFVPRIFMYLNLHDCCCCCYFLFLVLLVNIYFRVTKLTKPLNSNKFLNIK